MSHDIPQSSPDTSLGMTTAEDKSQEVDQARFRRMRDLNNLASRRCRLRRRQSREAGEIKRVVLESLNEVLHDRVAKLKLIKEHLWNACLSIDDRSNICDCLNFPDVMRKILTQVSYANISNEKVVRRSRIMRELEFGDLADMDRGLQLHLTRPMKRGRKPLINFRREHLLEDDWTKNNSKDLSELVFLRNDKDITATYTREDPGDSAGIILPRKTSLIESQVLSLNPDDEFL